MGRSRYRILQSEYPHFLTCTVLNWIPLSTRPATVQIVLDALSYRRQQNGWRIYGYVILENHMHLLIQTDDLANQLAHFKSYTARQLIDYFHGIKAERLLVQLTWFRKAHKTDRAYQLWEEGSHPQSIDNPEVLRQKLDYIHLNPAKRGYVDLPEHWRYSSARDYAGLAGLLPVYRDWF
ncbi:REP-associated tyrosine transposase [Methylomonas rhizoryzae]|uniref:REP-associated tyrosine transposase n=1 Tax=Methylomonas rhizoryzae TaxID=2608981 RepID=UPI001232408E|nr:transposase [Methylomonas rhizoryzae]